MDESGATLDWVIEEPSAIALNNAGVSRDLFTVGMNVRVAGPVSERREGRMVGWHWLLPPGLEVIMVPNRSDQPRWADTAAGSDVVADLFSATGPVPDDGKGIFRVWSWEPVSPFWMMRDADQYPLTEAAMEAQSEWDADDPVDNLTLRCEPPGMPATMGDPHPIEFVDLGDTIEIRMEEFDQVRTIHMDSTQNPSEVPRSPLGYSTGRWEGDTLIVETNRLNARYFNRHGIPQSEDARIEERFTMDVASGKLNYVLTVTDPVNLTVPFVERLVWNWNENSRRQRYDCQVFE